MYSNPTAILLPSINYRWVFLASLLVSLWLIALDPLVNRDAIIYLRTADAYLDGGFVAAQQLFGRPFLPISIALIHQVSGLPLLYAGLLITSLCYALLCTGFVATVHALGGDRRVQYIAAFIVLSHPMINQARSDIMRDPAFWALIIMAFRELILYVRNPSMASRLRWFGYVSLAILFRFEGLFFAIFAPLALLFTRNLAHKLRHCLYLLVPQILAVTALLIAIALYKNHLVADSSVFPAIVSYFDKLLALPGDFAALAIQVGEPMLVHSSREDAPLALATGLIAVLLINLVRAITWPWALVLLWGRRAGTFGRISADDAVILRFHIVISLSYLALFMLINRFMLERYSNQLVILLLLYLPFALSALYNSGGYKRYLAISLLVIMSLDTLHTGDRDKAFINTATQWVKATTPATSRVLANEPYIAYFSERSVDWNALLHIRADFDAFISKPQLWGDTNYMVIYLKKKQYAAWQTFLEANALVELRTFDGADKGMVSVVEIHPATPARPSEPSY